MVVHDLDVKRIAARPSKAYAPLVIDPYAVLPDAIPSQLFESIPGRHSEFVQRQCRVENPEFPQHDPPKICGKAADGIAVPEPGGISVSEAPYHEQIITRAVINGKRWGGRGRSVVRPTAHLASRGAARDTPSPDVVVTIVVTIPIVSGRF